MAILEPDSDNEIATNLFSAESNETEAEEEQKPDHLQDHYFPSIESTVVIRQLRSLGLSFQLWPSASSLVNFLSLPASASFLPRRPSLRVLELGSGTGFVGISVAAVLSAHVTITDLPHVLPNLRFNSEANSELVSSRGGKVNVAALSWGEEEEMKAIGRDYDLILGSDVVYHDHLYDPLLHTLRYLMVGERERVFIMGHLKRWKKENVFFKNARKVFDVEAIHKDDPCDGRRVGIVVYRFRAKK